jgi:hypothetical protein
MTLAPDAISCSSIAAQAAPSSEQELYAASTAAITSRCSVVTSLPLSRSPVPSVAAQLP